jgi:DNA-binding XRE family transcriptional regulator
MDAKKLGKKIKVARVELDLTQSELAKKIHTNQKSLSLYETGKVIPSLETLIKIAGVLKKTASHFIDE